MHISMAFVDPGDEVLIPNPLSTTVLYQTYRGKIRYYDFSGREVGADFEALENEDTKR
jgi:aspartate/methionine/tyrosine aminotransferase